MKFTGTLADPVEGDQVKLEVELDPVGTAFAGDGLQAGALVDSGSAASVTISALTPGPYHWRARTVDDEGATSAWVAFGDNPESIADFEIHAVTSLLYTGDQLVRHGEDVTARAVLSSDWAGCVAGQQVVFSLPDDNPTTVAIDDGPYLLGTDETNGSGLAALAAIDTSGWEPGVYTVRARFAETSACEPSFDDATLTVAPTGDSASGGGFYTLPGNGRVNFGFTVSMVPGTEADPQYKGQLLLINNGKWRLKGVLDDYVALDTSGAASGTGNLYWWDATLDGGLGDWVLADTGVPFTISFDDIGRGKNAEDAFGIHIDHVLDGEPHPLPNSDPQLLKGGNVAIHEDSDSTPPPPEGDDTGNNGKGHGKNKDK